MSPPPSARPCPRSARRSLSHVGGEVEVEGAPSLTGKLARALAVEAAQPPSGPGGRTPRDAPDRAHVHGFHSYPARMHPETASRLVEAFSGPRETVLDPFCGSGTVLVEAMLAGRTAVGTDLNPVAVELAQLKTHAYTAAEIEELLSAAARVRARADSRRIARAGATQRFPPEDVAFFEPHVLLELDGLRSGVAGVDHPLIARTLRLVLSSLLVKVSRKRGDTSDELTPRRLAAGYTAKLFFRKTEELGRRLAAFTRALPSPPPPRARIALDDATRLESVPPRSIDTIVTSPPYVATYDYLAHHALRLRWLELDAGPLIAGELGARRSYAHVTGAEARRRWRTELSAFFEAAAVVLRPRGQLVLLMGDSAVGDEALRADRLVLELCARSPFLPLARASQRRPHFHVPSAHAFRDAPRAEHALLLQRR